MNQKRIRLVLLVLLLGLGIVAGQAISRARTSDARREAALQNRFSDGRQVLDPTTPLVSVVEFQEDFWAKWWERVDVEDRAFCEELRERLDLHLDLLEAEYAEAAEIYVSGRLPEGQSETVQDLRTRARARLGPDADELLGAYDTLRETAYRVSIAHGGVDPTLRDISLENSQLRQWLPAARRLVVRLTESPESQTER